MTFKQQEKKKNMVRYENEIRIICDRAWENLSYLHILYFEKYEFEILNALLFSCGAIQSRQIFYTNSVVI